VVCLAARIRLQRHGRKRLPFYRVVVADSRSSRDGKFIEKIGHYGPIAEPETLSINEERALYWLNVGAKPSDTVRSILRKIGVWQKFKAPEQVSEVETELGEEKPEQTEQVSEVETDDKSETELDKEKPKQNEVEQ